MKKANSYKVIYLFALILNLTLFKLSNNYSDEKDHATINAQQDYSSKLTYVNSSQHFEMAFPLPSDIILLSSNVRKPTPQIVSDIIKVAVGEDDLPILQSNPGFISAN